MTVALLLLVFAATVAFATGGKGQGHDKREVCHPKEGGWVLIRPDKASSHIDESKYPNGTYWKHTHDGRHDLYADSAGKCPLLTVPSTTTTGGTSSTTTTTAPTETTTTSTGTSSTTTTKGTYTAPPPTGRPTRTKPPTGTPTKQAPPVSTPESTTSSRTPSGVTPPTELAFTGTKTTLAIIGGSALALGLLFWFFTGRITRSLKAQQED
jgi:hypothetical protein